MDIQDALDLHLKEEAFRIIGKPVGCCGQTEMRGPAVVSVLPLDESDENGAPGRI